MLRADMARPGRFEANRWLGDKRSMRVHDLDNTTDSCAIDDLLASERFLAFGPDLLAEARNRCFHACPHCAAQVATG
jgi:hypothetical protein